MMRKKPKDAEEHTFIGILINNYTICSEASLSLQFKTYNPFLYNAEDPAFEYITNLVLYGTCIYPDTREGDNYEMTFRGGEIHAGDYSLTLKDYQVKDEYNVPVYKTYRGNNIPVFEAPKGLSILNKRRGEKVYDSWICVKQELVRDMLVSLSLIEPLYLSIHEMKTQRQRWIQSISLQSSNPAEE